jgi:hypothetical protein
MVEHDMDIYVLPHIDSGGGVRTWRNWVDFDPLEKYGGYSYADLMIGSIVGALAETATLHTRTELALSGEMGTSLFRYPKSYREVMQQLRLNATLKQLKAGISLNHDKIAGEQNPTGVPDIQLTESARGELQSLIDECEFIGMSFYRPVTLPITTDDFIEGIDQYMLEYKKHGLEVPTTKPLHFSEVGIGGGNDVEDEAGDPAKAVETPWAGSGDERTNPWSTAAMRTMRQEYHNALLNFLTVQPSKWHVSAAFFWSMGSWDPQGMRHPAFADEKISEAIVRHNNSLLENDDR